MSFSAITVDELEGNPDVPSTASLDFSSLFSLQLAVTTAGMYNLSASIQRAADPLSTPATITFGPTGGAPIVSLENAGGPWPPGIDAIYPQTAVLLQPGTYTLRIADGDSRSGGPHSYLHHSKLDFSLVVVPEPGAAALALVGLAAGACRRRR